MKNKLSFPFLLGLLGLSLLIVCTSCTDDEDVMGIDIPESTVTSNPFPNFMIENGDTLRLNIEKYKSLFPLELYQQNTKLLFKNSLGQERLFLMTSASGIGGFNLNCDIADLDQLHYYFEFIDFLLIDQSHPNPNHKMQFRLTPGVEYFEREYDTCLAFNVFKSIIHYIPFATERFICDRSYDASGVEVTILDKTFDHVEVREYPQNNGIRKVYYTTTEGIVGFEDEFGIPYVFDSFQ